MKKYISVFSLYVRSSIYKLFAVIILMTAAQIVLFKKVLHTVTDEIGNRLLGVEVFIEESKISLVFAVAFIVVTIFLMLVGCEFAVKQGYTLRRLRINEKETLICQTVFNALTYTVLLVSELAVSIVLCRMYLDYADTSNAVDASLIGNQTIFLAYYRSNFLHALLPLDDIFKHFVNAVSIIAMGFTSALFPYFTRRKKLSLEMFILIPVIALNFASDWRSISGEAFVLGACAVLSGIALIRLGSEEKNYG